MNTIGKVISILLSISLMPAAAANRTFQKQSLTVRSTFAYKDLRCSMTASGALLSPHVVVSSAHVVFADSSKLKEVCPKFYRALPKGVPNLYSAHKISVWIGGQRHKASRAVVPRGYLGIRHAELDKPFAVNPFVYGSRLNDFARIELERPTRVLPQPYQAYSAAQPGMMTILPRSGHPILQIRREVSLKRHARCAGAAKVRDRVVTDCRERVPMTMKGATLVLDEEGMPDMAHELNGVSGSPLYDAAGMVIGVFSGCRWNSSGETRAAYVTLFGADAMQIIVGRLNRAIILPLN